MTCIVGAVDKDGVVIGGDSAGVAGLDLTVRADEKVFTNGEFLFGFTSSFRMGQLLRYAFSPPPVPEGKDVFAYMVTDFIDAVRSCLKHGGFASKENETESGGTFLVGFRGRLFEINSDYQVGEPRDEFAAVGCGEQIAKGAMYALRYIDQPSETKVSIAINAAERFSAGVRLPYVIKRIP